VKANLMEGLSDVAIAHDYLTQRGGAERVALSLLRAFPSAVLYTTLFEPSSTYPEIPGQRVVTGPLNRVGVLRRHHRLSLPLLAPAVATTRVPARVTICTSSGWAHGVQTAGRKIVYCYAPARWLYQGARYLGQHNLTGRAALAVLGNPLRLWDRRAALSAHRYIAVSTMVRDQVKKAYGIEAEVLPCPVTLDLRHQARPVAGLEPGFLLVVSRLLPYKNVDAAIEAVRMLPRQRLVVVGQGPEYERLKRGAPRNVLLLGRVADDQLRWLYHNAAVMIAPSFEDFGLTPLEGARAGKPTVALRAGGYLDTVVEGVTGVFFDALEPWGLRESIVRALSERWDEAAIRAHSSHFSEERFATRLQEIVREELRVADLR
jgi:glycosyltransferase involved in cell wall biosynthesis